MTNYYVMHACLHAWVIHKVLENNVISKLFRFIHFKDDLTRSAHELMIYIYLYLYILMQSISKQ